MRRMWLLAAALVLGCASNGNGAKGGGSGEQYAGPAGDLWYDDIAVGTMPIGCD